MSSENEQTQIVECPICYDEIDQLKNCVTTECGHQFHCKCLMQNSATNGFSCPMCRSIMAEEAVSDSESEDSQYYEDEDDNEEADIEAMDDNTLTSFRMFHQQLDGEEVEEEPEVPEENAEENAEEIPKPSLETITAKLVAQGFTMEDMVKCLLIEHEEYDSDLEVNGRFSDRMFGKFRQIISNYPREMEEQPQANPRRRQREEVEDSFANIQNRYHVLYNDDDEEDDEEEDE